VTTIKPPDDSLNSYFDDLLGGEEEFDAQASPSVATNVLVLPTKNLGRALDEKYTAGVSVNQSNVKSALNTGTKSTSAQSTSSQLLGKPHTPELKSRQAQNKFNDLQPFAEPEPTQTQEQKQKLEKLLQTARTQLLISAPAEVSTETQTATEVKPEVVTGFQVDPHEIQEWDVETTELEVPVVLEPPMIVEQVASTTESVAYHLEGVEWLENGRPAWAQTRFDVLLFQVSGLTLAVPLISLGQIQAITEELTPLFGQADWFMGFQLTPRGKVSTVNTAKFVMPERYDENFVKTAKYVVSINGVPWGLAVDSVNQPISLYPEDVKWRTDRSKRPWLAGTVKEHMCALLDIPRIGQMLIDADKNAGRLHR